MVLAAGLTPDAILSTTGALIVGLSATAVALVIAVMQNRAKRSESNDAITTWRRQVDELSARLEAIYESRHRSDASRIAKLERAVEARDHRIAQLTGTTEKGD